MSKFKIVPASTQVSVSAKTIRDLLPFISELTDQYEDRIEELKSIVLLGEKDNDGKKICLEKGRLFYLDELMLLVANEERLLAIMQDLETSIDSFKKR